MDNTISHMTWMEFDERRKTEHRVILVTGAVEAYGPHLPMGSDYLVTKRLGEILSERTGAFLGPVVPVGDSLSLSHFPGTLCVKPEAFKEYMRGIIDSLLGWGMKNFLILNGHAGNTAVLTQLANEAVMKDSTLRFAQIDWWRYVQTADQGICENKGYMAHGHASECGTSVLLYLYPELVRRELMGCEEPKVVNGRRFPGIIRTTPFEEFSDRATIGDASAASAEKGKALVEECLRRIEEYMKMDFE